jgi:hypothetical protein
MIMIHLIQIIYYDSERAISITFSLRFDRFKLRFVTKFFDRKKIRLEKETWKFHVLEKLIIHIFKVFFIAMFWIVLEENMNSNSFVSFETIDSKDIFERYLNIRSFADIRRLIHKTRVHFFEDKTHLNKNDDLRNRMLFIQQMKTYMLLKYVISHANLTLIIYVFNRVIVLFHDFNKYKYSFEMLYLFWLTCIEITTFELKLVILNNSMINMKESIDKFIAMNLYLKIMNDEMKNIFRDKRTFNINFDYLFEYAIRFVTQIKKKLKKMKLCHNVHINKKQHSINAKKNIIKLAINIKKNEIYRSNRKSKKTLNLYFFELETLKNEVDKFNAKNINHQYIELMLEREDIQFDLSSFLIELNVDNDENEFLNINRVID